MIIASLGLAFWAFLIAYELLPKLWQSVMVAIVIFFATMIAITCDITALLAIIIIALPLLTIILFFAKNSKG